MGLMDKVGNFLQGDFVKNGVREMMIARPEDNNDLVYKWPDRTIPMFAQCTVRADEWAVFAKEGKPVGTLDAGRCTLSTANIPFLSNFIDQYTGGNFLMTELFFVKRTPFPMKFGGSLGHMIDPSTQIRVRARSHGELLLRVENPETMIYQYFGMRKYQEHPEIFDWFTNAFFTTVKTTLGKMAKEQGRTLLDIMDLQSELANGFVANCADLAAAGIRVVKVTQFEVDMPEEDVKRFDELRQKVAEANISVQVAQQDVAKAALEAQRMQILESQRIALEAQRVQAVAADPNRLAALGQYNLQTKAGEAMATHGMGGSGVAGTFAQAAIGMNIGSNLGAQATGARGAAPAGGAGVVALVGCPACAAQVPPGKFCAECGGTLASARKRCASCGVDLLATARFCPECGTPAGAQAPAGPAQSGG